MENKLDWNSFKEFFHESWWEDMKPAIESEWMFNIYQKLKEDSKKDVICPESHNVFRAFKNCDKNKIKTVWYLMDPYSRRYKDGKFQATGIPMDCSNSSDGKLQPSLEIFYDGISAELGRKVERSKTLDYLIAQGVLMLNTDLTVKLNKTNSHDTLWEPFQQYLLEEVLSKKVGIIYILFGKNSQKLEKYISPLGNYIFKVIHPAAAAHTHTDWNTQGVFRKSNSILLANGGSGNTIFWNKEELETVPF